MNVVLVHGFLNRGGILRRLANYLQSQGHTCFVPTLKPCDARGGIPQLAEQLAGYIRCSFSESARFALVGFSMGALISRYYLQELGGLPRTEAFFSISGPHAGTVAAYFYPSMGVRQMRPKSEFLARLGVNARSLAGLPVTCYWTPYDLMVRPAASARWAGAEHVRIAAPLHALMVFNRQLYEDLAQRLELLGVVGG